MSHSRKHMTQGYKNIFPEPKPTEKIGRVTELRGSNQCEVEYPNGERVLVRFPSKFKKLLWIKRGDYLILEPFRDMSAGKIKGQVSHLLLPEDVEHLQEENMWPEEFVIETGKKEAKENATSNSQDVENQDSDYDLGEYVNPNRVGVQDSSEEEDEDDEDEEDEEDQQSGEEEDEEENEQIEGEEKEDNN
jgi:probable RNA-binding protein EIF1AD